jgi:TonB family protein
MDWQDDEFEVLLRQFRPHRPKPLPTRRVRVMPLAVAALVALGLVVPIRIAIDHSSHNDTKALAPATPRTAAETGAAAATTSPTSSTLRDVPSPNAPLSNRPVHAVNGTATRRIRVGEAVKPPIKLVDVKPVYPDEAQAAGIDGVVLLDIVIGTAGFVIDTEVIQSVPALDQAAIDAVRQWQFEPTLFNGEPVEVEMTVVINFTLQ